MLYVARALKVTLCARDSKQELEQALPTLKFHDPCKPLRERQAAATVGVIGYAALPAACVVMSCIVLR